MFPSQTTQKIYIPKNGQTYKKLDYLISYEKLMFSEAIN